MPKILALDTSTDACSVALNIDGQITEDFRVIPRQHTQELLPMTEAILSGAGLAVTDLDAIAFGRGPGSFAGIRIATGVAQGLGYAAGLNLIPVSTLASIALSYHKANGSPQVLAAIDARMNEIYWAAYRFKSGLPELIGEERVDAPVNVTLPNHDEWHGAGTGWRYQSDMAEDLQTLLAQDDRYPCASCIAEIAAAELQRGNTVQPEEALPVYLRDDVAWKKKDQQ